MAKPSANSRELCGRAVSTVTRHHLIPKTRHKSKKNKKLFDRTRVKRTAWLCKPCHNQIHAVLTAKEIELEYNTPEKLLVHPEIRKFIKWIRKKPDGTAVPVKLKKDRRP